MLPTVDVPAVKKSVTADLKEVRKATDALAKLSASAKKNRMQPDVGDKLVNISSATRERARGTSRTLHEALQVVEDGTAEHRVLTALSEEFKQTLRNFTQEVEQTAHLIGPAAQSFGGGGASGDPGPVSGDLEWGRGPAPSAFPAAGGSGMGGGSDPENSGAVPSEDQRDHAQQMSAVVANEAIIAEREVGIGQLSRSVQEVNEIFQDLALLVNEQGTQIDNIQTNIETAASRTDAGVRELARASRHQRAARGRMLIITACVLVLIIILFMVLKFSGKF